MNTSIVIPFYNAVPWLGASLLSVERQIEAHSVICIDDSSIDESGTWAEKWCNGHDRIYLRTPHNMKCPQTLWWGLSQVEQDDEDIIILLDGDDWFYAAGSVYRIRQEYENDPNLWLMWGQYTRWPDPNYMPNPSCAYPPHVLAANSFRTHNWLCYNHPLTFKRWLWDQLTEDDFKDDNGIWFDAGYDAAIMYPLMELAGAQHLKFLDEVLYVYNENNPTSDSKVRPERCDHAHGTLRRRQPKAQLPGKPQ